LLVVDNDEALARAMEESLAKVGYECVVATSGPEGARKIETDTFDVIVTDLVMNDVDGMEILARARQALPDAEVILVTGHATVPKAVEAMQQGAFNFLEKPITPNRLRATCEKAADAIRLKRQNTELRERLDERFGFEGIIYSSSQMQTVIDRLKRIAPTDASVLISGESGTGKELVAQAIHHNSPRKGRRIVALNCAAVAENLVESELFGHVKGAYTDAHTDRIGAFEYANGGTLFLDEVGDLGPEAQAKLLRVLESGVVERVGGEKPFAVNVRVLAATNKDLRDALRQGQFREDLWFRLNVLPIHIPPLRERPEDVAPLVRHFAARCAARLGRPVKFDSGTIPLLAAYTWPGNVRELANIVERLAILSSSELVTAADVARVLPQDGIAPRPAAAADGETPWRDIALSDTLDQYERELIARALSVSRGNVAEAARRLLTDRANLYRRMRRLGIEPPRNSFDSTES